MRGDTGKGGWLGMVLGGRDAEREDWEYRWVVVGFALLLLMAQWMEEFSPIDNNSIVDTWTSDTSLMVYSLSSGGGAWPFLSCETSEIPSASKYSPSASKWSAFSYSSQVISPDFHFTWNSESVFEPEWPIICSTAHSPETLSVNPTWFSAWPGNKRLLLGMCALNNDEWKMSCTPLAFRCDRSAIQNDPFLKSFKIVYGPIYFRFNLWVRPLGKEIFLVDMYTKSFSVNGMACCFLLASHVCFTCDSSIESWAEIIACFIRIAKICTPGYSVFVALSQIMEHGILPLFKKKGVYPVISERAEFMANSIAGNNATQFFWSAEIHCLSIAPITLFTHSMEPSVSGW